MTELEVLLSLNRTGFVGSTLLGRLRRAFGSLERAASATARELAGVEGIGDSTARAIRRSLELNVGARELEAARKSGCRVVTPADDDYPSLLRPTIDAPPVLYVRGNLRENDALAVALVGTRNPTPYGISMAQKLARGLADLGITVVSGLARGIDSAAHVAALEKGRSIAVLGCGLNQVYPPENRGLAARLSAVVSEFPMDEPPRPAHFPRRNRIISGLSLGTVCIEASMTSGALVSCAWALDQGREVFAVPGRVDNALSRGPHHLIRHGAKLVEDVLDIVEEISAFGALLERIRTQEPQDPLQRVVWASVREGANTIDRVLARTRLGRETVERLVEELIADRRLNRAGRLLRAP